MQGQNILVARRSTTIPEKSSRMAFSAIFREFSWTDTAQDWLFVKHNSNENQFAYSNTTKACHSIVLHRITFQKLFVV